MTSRDKDMSNHEFVLVLSGISDLNETIVNALFEAGCDDATPSLRYGTVSLDFDREAPSLKEAILSAIRDVSQAGIGAAVKSVDNGNLVTQADIARRIGKSRQLVGQYTNNQIGPGNFPGPQYGLTDGHPLWSWCEVASWLYQNGLIKERDYWESKVIAAINLILDLRNQFGADPDLVGEIMKAEGFVELCEPV